MALTAVLALDRATHLLRDAAKENESGRAHTDPVKWATIHTCVDMVVIFRSGDVESKALGRDIDRLYLAIAAQPQLQPVKTHKLAGTRGLSCPSLLRGVQTLLLLG